MRNSLLGEDVPGLADTHVKDLSHDSGTSEARRAEVAMVGVMPTVGGIVHAENLKADWNEESLNPLQHLGLYLEGNGKLLTKYRCNRRMIWLNLKFVEMAVVPYRAWAGRI